MSQGWDILSFFCTHLGAFYLLICPHPNTRQTETDLHFLFHSVFKNTNPGNLFLFFKKNSLSLYAQLGMGNNGIDEFCA